MQEGGADGVSPSELEKWTARLDTGAQLVEGC